jgi:3-oxoacyl-[acyl-carrier protein] reductase
MSPSAIEATQPSNGLVPAEPLVHAAPASPFPTLAGKVALITGSGRGIGKGMAIELAARGASVVVNYAKSAEKAQEVVKEIVKLGSKAVAIQADVSKPEEIFSLFKQAVAHFGHLDIVVSNSGTEVWSKEEDVTPADFDYIFNINCRGQFFVAQQGLKYLGCGGRIILMSSVAATMSGVPNHALYAGSKAAVEGFTRSFSVDCGEKGITVNAIAPGGVKTDMFDANAWVRIPSLVETIMPFRCSAL